MDAQDEFIRRVSKSNALRGVKMPSRRRGMSEGPTWSEIYPDTRSDIFPNLDRTINAECDQSVYDEYDDAGVEKRTNAPATILGYALLGCMAVVVSAIAWAFFFHHVATK